MSSNYLTVFAPLLVAIIAIATMAPVAFSFSMIPTERQRLVNTVQPSTSCGGSGKFLGVKATGCFSAPCNLTVNSTYSFGITFVAGETTDKGDVMWQLWSYSAQSVVFRIQQDPYPGVLVAGKKYSISNDVMIPDRVADVTGQLLIMLLDTKGLNHLICGQFSVYISKPK